MMKKIKKKDYRSGSASLMVLIFGVVASIIVGGLVTIATIQISYISRGVAFDQALSIAEAGIN